MPSYLSPGVYTRETDLSFYVKQISTSACGMIGYAQKGPIDKATLVTSWEQFVKRYGSYMADSYLAYAARAFFDNGGQVLYVSRAGHYGWVEDRSTLSQVKSYVSLLDRELMPATLNTGTAGTNKIVWTAKTPGTGGNAITIALTKAGNNTPFSISVANQAVTINLATDAAGNVTTTPVIVANAVNVHAAASALVQALALDSGIVTPVAATPLAGGREPRASLTVSAISEGTWGDAITVEVKGSEKSPTDRFDLRVWYKGELVEAFPDLSMDSASPAYVELMVNGMSEYVTVHDEGVATNEALKRPNVGSSALVGGDDALWYIEDADYIGMPNLRTGFYAFDEIEDLNLLLIPGVTSVPVMEAAIAYAESRKDLMYLMEAPIHLTPQEATDFRKGKGTYTHAAFNTSYSALYYPWIEISDPLTGKTKLVPPTGAIAGCIARNDEKAEVWYAPAGIDRGRIFGALSLAYTTTRSERDVLYAAGVNVIASFPDTGINIWGQKTLQSQPSATDRINVRRLMMYVEEAISQSSRFVVFEPHNSRTWRALVRMITPFLQSIKSRGGFYDFRVQCDEETNTPQMIDQNQLVCRAFIKPTKTAEFVEMNFILTATGADFREVL